MIPLLHFAVSASLVSAAAGVSVRLAANAPPRLKFWMAMLGLAAWLVPWPLIALPPLFDSPPPVAGWVGQSVRAVGTHADLPAPLTSLGLPASIPAAAWLLLLAPGLVWFAFDYSAHRRTLRAWSRHSRDGSALSRLLPPSLGGCRTRIRVISGTATAAASGVLRPTLWIGDRLAGGALRTALTHEYCHARSRDPFWLLLIQLIRRAYCWNPVVGALARQAELWLEADCDRRCADVLGRRSYSESLARLILSNGRRASGIAALVAGRSQNVRRLELLQRPVRAGWREYACLALCAATVLGGISFAAPLPDPRIGTWAEVGESAPDDDPILRSFENLGGGLTRLKDDVLHDGTAMLWSDHRCDGRDYAVRNRSGDRTGWTQSCRMLDPLTVEVAVSEADELSPAWRAVDRVSEDGETYTSVVTMRTPDGGDAASVTRVFWRLH